MWKRTKGKKCSAAGPLLAENLVYKQVFQGLRQDFRGIKTEKEIGTVRKEQNH
jgi:hypothetical protein